MKGTAVTLSKEEFVALYRKKISDIQVEMLKEHQIELPLLHDFSPGLYIRRIFMPKDTFVIGKTHKTEHFNIVFSGLASVMIDGEIKLVKGGDMFKSGAGVKKVLYIHQDMIWATTHPTEETDMETLEKELVLSYEEETDQIETMLQKLIEGSE